MVCTSHDLVAWWCSNFNVGEQWKIHRRMFHRQFQQSVAPIHWPIQRKEAHALLRRLLDSPDDLIEHLRQ